MQSLTYVRRYPIENNEFRSEKLWKWYKKQVHIVVVGHIVE